MTDFSLNAAIVIQARMGSTRLPGKTMLPLRGIRMLEHIVNRFQQAPVSGPLIIATSTSAVDDFICSMTESKDIACSRGSEEDVLDRYWQAVKDLDVDFVVRATADNPLVFEGAVEHLGRVMVDTGCDYITYTNAMPVGMSVELLRKDVLARVHEQADKPFEREHVTPHIYTNADMFDIIRLAPPEGLQGEYRLTVDTREDYELVKHIYDELYKPGSIIPALAVIEYLDANPEVAAINAAIRQKRYDE